MHLCVGCICIHLLIARSCRAELLSVCLLCDVNDVNALQCIAHLILGPCSLDGVLNWSKCQPQVCLYICLSVCVRKLVTRAMHKQALLHKCHFLIMLLGVLTSAQLSAVCMLETIRQLNSHSCACLSVCRCSKACLCIAGVLSGICFRRRSWSSAQFPAKIPRPGFSLHALTYGRERAHHGPFRRSAEAFLPNPTSAQHAPGRVLLPCGFIQHYSDHMWPSDWTKLDQHSACKIRVMRTKTEINVSQDPSHKSFHRVLARTLHVYFWRDIAACSPHASNLHKFACLHISAPRWRQ